MLGQQFASDAGKSFGHASLSSGVKSRMVSKLDATLGARDPILSRGRSVENKNTRKLG